MATTDVQKWGDAHMYESKPIESTSPKVTLISMTPDPLGALAMAAKTYRGEYAASLAEITDEERLSYFRDMSKTTLNAAFECIDFHFRIEGVTRAFTHQLVRQRTAVYFQESMRFAVINESFADRVGLPPSLQGTVPAHEFYAQCFNEGVDPETNCSEAQNRRNRWDEGLRSIEHEYKALIDGGMPAEEARGLLPTNILTRIQYKTNLRNLVQHAGLRLCTQAQFEWRLVFSQIAAAIRKAEVIVPFVDNSPDRDYDGRGELHVPVWMADQIANTLFRPICYQTGSCQFEASFDRSCTIRDRVQANAEIGRNSREWGKEYDVVQGNPIVAGVGPRSVLREGDEKSRPVFIGAINSMEWLADDGAARA